MSNQKRVVIFLVISILLLAAFVFALEPSINSLTFNATEIANRTLANLTVYASTSDPESDPVKLIYNWIRNGTSFSLANLPFEGGSNASWTRDYGNASRNGTVFGATWRSNRGFDGKGTYQFDGSDDYVYIGNNLINLNTNFTIESWVNISSTTQNSYTIFGISQPTDPLNTGYALLIHRQDQGGVTWQYDNGSSGTLFTNTPSSNLTANTTWYHVVLTRDISNDSIKIYQNGIEISNTNAVVLFAIEIYECE